MGCVAGASGWRRGRWCWAILRRAGSKPSVRRLLAYSAIARAGYMLAWHCGAPLLRAARRVLLFYALTYALTTVGAFGVIAIVERSTGSDRLDAAQAGPSQSDRSTIAITPNAPTVVSA